MKIYKKGPFNIIHIKDTTGGISHRRTITPLDDYSNESDDIKAACDEAFTDAIKAAYIEIL
jgi:hypothetical protein